MKRFAALTLALIALLGTACSGTQTVCATDEALAYEPRMHEILVEAVAYWTDLGWEGVRVVEGNSCDVPVTFDESVPRVAITKTDVPFFDETACAGVYIRINPLRWAEVIDRGAEVRVLSHEIGHLHCLEDIEIGGGVMSQAWHVSQLSEYQLDDHDHDAVAAHAGE